MTQTATGEWILSPSNDLNSAKLREGLASLSQELLGGPTQRIAGALMRLVSATRRPAWMDDETAAVYFDTLQEALHDYPIDVVEESCMAWRRGDNGEWWPAEAELRRVCAKLFEPRRALKERATALLAALESEEERVQRGRSPSHFAGDRHREFRNEMRKRMAPNKFDAYFHPTQVKYQGEDVILVRSPGAQDRLRELGGDALQALGLTLRFCQFSWLHERPYFEEPETDEERAAAAAMLRNLAKTLAGAAAPKRAERVRQRPSEEALRVLQEHAGEEASQ